MAAPRDLSSATVVVTGAAGGLGAAMARRFVGAGSRVTLLDIDGEGVTALAQELGDQALAVACDVTDATATHAAVAAAAAHFGGIDVLINNAGLTHRSAFVDTDPEVLRRVMAVNYFGAVNVTHAALPFLVERSGAIGVISSIAGFAPLLGRTGYAASKHALHGLFDTLRGELRGTGVDVTIVCPSFIDTPFRDHTLDGDGSLTTHPQSRVGSMVSADSVAEVVYASVTKRRKLVVLTPVGKTTRALTKIAPGLYDRIMTRQLRSELER